MRAQAVLCVQDMRAVGLSQALQRTLATEPALTDAVVLLKARCSPLPPARVAPVGVCSRPQLSARAAWRSAPAQPGSHLLHDLTPLLYSQS